MVASRREVIVIGEVRGIRQGPDVGATLLARAEPGVMAQLLECRPGWCRIAAGDVSGWIERADVWGIEPNETVP
jgi:SH3-like domain-containing protein